MNTRLVAPAVLRRIDTRGKHALFHFDRAILRVHLGMTGSWHRYDPGERWQVHPQYAKVVFETASDVVVCFKPGDVELMDHEALARHPVLASLGPDLLDGGLPFDAIASRAGGDPRASAEILLDQRIACGLGNVWKSELLFVHRVHPHTPGTAVGTWREIYETAADFLRRNLDLAERTSNFGRGPPLFVYGRAGRACLRCRASIRSERQAGRPTYWCPRCQVRTTGAT